MTHIATWLAALRRANRISGFTLNSQHNSRASDKCRRERRKTINGDDLLWAMTTLGFEEYVHPLKMYLVKYREVLYTLGGLTMVEDAALCNVRTLQRFISPNAVRKASWTFWLGEQRHARVGLQVFPPFLHNSPHNSSSSCRRANSLCAYLRSWRPWKGHLSEDQSTSLTSDASWFPDPSCIVQPAPYVNKQG